MLMHQHTCKRLSTAFATSSEEHSTNPKPMDSCSPFLPFSCRIATYSTQSTWEVRNMQMWHMGTADDEIWTNGRLQIIDTAPATTGMRAFAERHVPPAADAALSKWRRSEVSSAACKGQHLDGRRAPEALIA